MLVTDEQAIEKFWSLVDKKGDTVCWRWLGATRSRGYGQFRYKGEVFYSHRVAWELANSQEIPEGLVVRHACDNPICVNPSHLLIGTQKDNTRDIYERGRDRHPRGSDAGRSVLSEDDVWEIRRLRQSGVAVSSIASRFGVHIQSVWGILSGRSWGWLE